MKKIIILLVILNISIAYSQYNNIFLGYGDETSIAINPANPEMIAASANLISYFWSVDGGESWNSKPMESIYNVWGDPCVIFDKSGRLYYGHLSNPSPPNLPFSNWIDRIVVQTSDDAGATWIDDVGVGYTEGKQQDKEWIATDMTNSQHSGNIYMSWTEFDSYGSNNLSDSSRILFARSTNRGVSWSSPVRISEHAGDCIDDDNTPEGAVPAVGPDGEVYVVWSFDNKIWFDKSTDGGLTFGKDTVIAAQPGGWNYDVHGIKRCNGLPVTHCDISNSPYRGTIYTLWTDQRNGEKDVDVFIIKSTDKGKTWTEPKKVNNDKSKTTQFFCWLAVDPITGYVYAIFYDRRNYDDCRTDIYVAKSTDGAETFDNYKINDEPIYFDCAENIWIGDYSGIAAYDGLAYGIWTEPGKNNAESEVWFAQVDGISDINIQDTIKAEIKAYPNPAKDFVNISVILLGKEYGTITALDMMGNVVAEIYKGIFDAGKNTETWKTGEIAPGCYFVRYKSNKEIMTTSVVIVH